MQIDRTTTRAQRLGWSPNAAIALLWQPGPNETSTIALAMAEQLAAAGVPVEALEICLMFWSRALDGLSAGAVPSERLARLDADLATETRGTPALQPWLAALRAPVTTAQDLDHVIRFLVQVRQLWSTADAAQLRDPRQTSPRPEPTSSADRKRGEQRLMLAEFVDYALYRCSQGREELDRGLATAASGVMRVSSAYGDVQRRLGNWPQILAHLEEGCGELRSALELLREHAPERAGALIEFVEMHLMIASDLRASVLHQQAREAR